MRLTSFCILLVWKGRSPKSKKEGRLSRSRYYTSIDRFEVLTEQMCRSTVVIIQFIPGESFAEFLCGVAAPASCRYGQSNSIEIANGHS